MSLPRPRRAIAAVAPVALAATLLAACSSDAEPGPTVDAAAASDGGTADGDAESALLAACGPELTAQLPWWPGVDYAFLFQLIGSDGEIDADENSYSGEIGDTGVTLEIRAGGPAAGFQRPQALVYQDDSIDVIVDSGGDQVGLAAGQPTVSVFSYYDTYPVVLIWGAEEWDFQSLEEIKDSGATVLAYGGASYVTALEQAGKLDPEQVDPSFDGSPARFVAEGGRIVQQDYITTGPYLLENVVEEWGRPVDFISVHEDFPVYGTTLQVRSDRLEELTPCLTELVPLVQQAAVDYALDPSDTNAALVELTNSLDGVAVQLTDELLAASNAAQIRYGLVQNGTDGTLGSFDLDRVRSNIDLLRGVYEANGVEVPEDLSPADLVTNEFLDPSISLPDDVPVPDVDLPTDVPGLGR